MINKKGTTLVEVIISIALISIVLTFMIKLLIDLNNTDTNNKYAKGNQIKRAEIIRTIEDDIKDKVITQISDHSVDESLIIEIKFNDGETSEITLTKNTITYKDADNKMEKWTLDEGSIYMDKIKVYLGYNSTLTTDAVYTLVIDIEIHTSNENNTFGNNNTLDDILINYIGYSYINVNNCLGNNC